MTTIFLLFLVSYVLSYIGVISLPRGVLFCGIAGYSLPFKPDPSRVKLLMLDNRNRGEHATGFVTTKGEVVKEAEDVQKFIANHHDELVDNQLITHTRHATMGLRTDSKLAHPFEFENLVGCHNGWLIDNERRKEIPHVCETFSYDPKDFPVDSMLIFHHMNEFSGAPETAIAAIEGAMALAWFDRSGNEAFEGKIPLCLYRRGSKPLYVAKVTYRKKEGIYYSSRKEGLKLVGIDEADIELIPTDTIFRYVNGRLIDYIDVQDPQIEIKLDEKPSEFNTRFKNNKALFKDHYTIEEGEEEKEEPRQRGKILPMYSMGSATPYGDLSPYSHLDAVGNYKGIVSKLIELGYYSVNVPFKKTLTSKIRSDRSSIIVELVDSKSGDPLKGFQVMIDEYPETMTVTKDNGVTGVFVLEEKIGKSIDLCIYPPVDYRKEIKGEEKAPRFFFLVGGKKNKSLHVTAGSVLEVTLKVPFLKTEEKAEKEGGYFSLEGYMGEQNEPRSIISDPKHFIDPKQPEGRNLRERSYGHGLGGFENLHEHELEQGPEEDDPVDAEMDLDEKLRQEENRREEITQMPKPREIDPDVDPGYFRDRDSISEIRQDFSILCQTLERAMEINMVKDEESLLEVYREFQQFLANVITKKWSRVFKIQELTQWTFIWFKKTMEIEDDQYDPNCKKWAMEQALYDVEEILKYIDEMANRIKIDGEV